MLRDKSTQTTRNFLCLQNSLARYKLPAQNEPSSGLTPKLCLRIVAELDPGHGPLKQLNTTDNFTVPVPGNIHRPCLVRY